MQSLAYMSCHDLSLIRPRQLLCQQVELWACWHRIPPVYENFAQPKSSEALKLYLPSCNKWARRRVPTSCSLVMWGVSPRVIILSWKCAYAKHTHRYTYTYLSHTLGSRKRSHTYMAWILIMTAGEPDTAHLEPAKFGLHSICLK